MTADHQASQGAASLRRIAGQGGLLMAGFGTVQALSFARNAMLGHALSRGDFGIAATITLTLQLVEILSDIGADRLVIQAPEAEASRTIATGHALLALRGLIGGLALYLLAQPLSGFFKLEGQLALFQAIALVPVVKGFLHLDPKRRQRDLDNRPHLVTEVGSQAVALILTPIMLLQGASPSIVIWLALGQAASAVVLSHATADRRYALTIHGGTLRRMLSLGWPIWLSAIPLLAVYQADRAIIGRHLGMVELAGYTAAFMITMVPGLIMAKVGNALMLPLLSQSLAHPSELALRYRAMLEATIVVACAYVSAFVVAGGDVLALAFGDNFLGLGALVGILALMWAVRIVQAVPGMALIATGNTRPLLWAGLIRAGALPLAIAVLAAGGRVEHVAATGIIGELASMALVARCVARPTAMTLGATALRAIAIAPVAMVAAVLASILPSALTLAGQMERIAAAGLMAIVTVLFVTLSMPTLRGWLRRHSVAVRGPAPHSP